MDNLIKNKKAWIILAGTVLIVTAFAVLNYLETKSNEPLPLEVKTAEIDKLSVPSGLPQNLPIEAGSKILQNSETRTNDGRFQSTREVTSKKSPQELLKTYTDFFTKEGYEGGFDEKISKGENYQVARMMKEGEMVQIVATGYDKDGYTSKIYISLTKLPK